MTEILFKEESFKIIGIYMEIHRELGMGFKEVNYKEALEIELKEKVIPFHREKRFKVCYKGKVLAHPYIADFVVYNSIVLEIKSATSIIDSFVAQTISYLKASEMHLGIIVNFGEKSLKWQCIVF